MIRPLEAVPADRIFVADGGATDEVAGAVLEVGEIKREISYLGDVLNTAARIQGMCNEVGEELLVSENLLERLDPLPAEFTVESIGSVELRGREQAVGIFSVHRHAPGSPEFADKGEGSPF